MTMKRPNASNALFGVVALVFVLGGLLDESLLFSKPLSPSIQERSMSIVKSSKLPNSTAPEVTHASLTRPQRKSNNTMLPDSRHVLPNFAHGGIVIFLHVPKCGGTTIRKGFQKRNHVTYLFSNRRSKYEEHVPKVNEWVQNNVTSTKKTNATVGILEIHARNNPSLLKICQQLQTWRATAAQYNVPFFAFTVLRDPQQFAISYYNYYHGIQWEPRRFEYLPAINMTDANFQRTMHFNPQCLFLARGEQAYQKNFPELRANLTKEECTNASQCLFYNMDWIGTTERLHNETIPLLDHLIDSAGATAALTTPTTLGPEKDSSRSTTKEIKTENTGPKLFGPWNMSQSSLDYFESMSEWDQELYRIIQEHYRFESFNG